jgi:ABC-type bacteriocin/lantibiotic exporter with double-glycine peptidase domain
VLEFVLRDVPRGRIELAKAFGCGLCDLATVLGTPLATAAMINAISAKDSRSVRNWAVVVVLLTLGHLLFGVVFRLMTVSFEQSVGEVLRRRAFRRASRVAPDQRAALSTGDALARILNDAGLLQTVPVNIGVQGALDATTLLLAGAILMSQAPPWLAVGVVATAAMSTLWVRRWTGEVERLSTRVREASGALAGAAQGWVSRHISLVTHRLDDASLESFSRASRESAGRGLELGRRVALVNGVNGALIGVPSSLVFVAGGWLALTGVMSLGSLIAFSIMAGYFHAPVQRLLGLRIQLAAAEPSLRRLAMLDRIVVVDDIDRGDERLISIRLTAASFRCAGGFRLHVPAFELRAGAPVLVLGDNGAGKTSFTSALLGISRLDCGSAELLTAVGAIPLRRHPGIAVLPQDVAVFPGTVVENLTLFNQQISRGSVADAAERVGLDRWIASLPQGLETQVDPSWSARMSGGQLRRLALARLICQRCDVVILDEPWSNLDDEMREIMTEWVRHAARLLPVLVIAHECVPLPGLLKYELTGSGSDRRLVPIGTQSVSANRLREGESHEPVDLVPASSQSVHA